MSSAVFFPSMLRVKFQLTLPQNCSTNNESEDTCGKVRQITGILSLLRLACWVKISADYILKYFLYLSQKIGFGIPCKLSPRLLNLPRDCAI